MQTKKKKKNKQTNILKKRMCNLHIGIFVTHPLEFHPPSFLPILRRKVFGGPKKKTPEAHHHFPLSPSQLNTLQKVFRSHFLSFCFSIIPKIHSTKHNLKDWI